MPWFKQPSTGWIVLLADIQEGNITAFKTDETQWHSPDRYLCFQEQRKCQITAGSHIAKQPQLDYDWPMIAADSHKSGSLAKPGHIATVVVIVLAYVVTIGGYLADLNMGHTPLFTAADLAAALVLGVIYLGVVISGQERLRPIFGDHATAAFFLLLIGLVVIIQFLVAGSGGIWLISMPLVALATTDVRHPWQWGVYLVVLLAFTVPFYLKTGDWRNALIVSLTFIPAIVFVVIFARITQAAEEAQLRAEQLAAQLKDANHSLAAFALQAEELATIQERNRLAREIHDNLGHYLTVVNVQIKAARAVMDNNPDNARSALDKAAHLTEEGLAAIRQSVSSLRESPLGNRSLPEAVAVLVEETQATGIVAELRVIGKPRTLDSRSELTLFRAAQEGLTNVRRHARASRVDLVLDFQDPAAVSLMARDNGPGRDLVTLEPGFGLLGLQERARLLGGTVEIETAVGAGFSLAVTVPDNPQQSAALPPASALRPASTLQSTQPGDSFR
jgi:signal transduction histidine kinase